jgi:hypothetical protein
MKQVNQKVYDRERQQRPYVKEANRLRQQARRLREKQLREKQASR